MLNVAQRASAGSGLRSTDRSKRHSAQEIERQRIPEPNAEYPTGAYPRRQVCRHFACDNDGEVPREYRRLLPVPKESFFLFGVRGVGKSTSARANLPGAARMRRGRVRESRPLPPMFALTTFC